MTDTRALITDVVRAQASADSRGADPLEFEVTISTERAPSGWKARAEEPDSGLSYLTVGHSSEAEALDRLLIRIKLTDHRVQLRCIETQHLIDEVKRFLARTSPVDTDQQSRYSSDHTLH